MKRLIKKRHGRRVPRATAMYAPNWTSNATIVVGIDSTMESMAKAGATTAATGNEAAAICATLATVNGGKQNVVDNLVNLNKQVWLIHCTISRNHQGNSLSNR
jgi:predicted Ser/Thr protein kinase